MADIGPGMSDFGLTNANDSTSIEGDASLSDLLGDAVLDEVSTSKLLSAQIDELKGQEGPSLLDKLLSPRGLAMLAATAGVGLSGGGALGTAAFGLSGVKSADAKVEAERSAQRGAIDKLEGDLEKSQSRLDKTRNRIATAFNTNPEAFLNPDGTPVVDERVLGWYMTGTEIPMFPQTRNLLKQRDARWSKRMDVLTEAMENADNPADATNLTKAMMRQLQWFDADDATVASIANSIGTDDFDSAFAATLFRNGGSSALDAMIFAGEEGLELSHPEVLRRIKFQNEADASQPPSQLLNQRFINDLDAVNAFEQNPLNREFVQTAKRDNNDEEARRIIAEQALAGIGSGEVDFYLDKVNSQNPDDFRRMFQAYSMIDSKTRLVDTVRGAQSLPEMLNLDDEQLRAWKANQANDLVGEAEASARQSSANQSAALRNRTAGAISTGLGLGVEATYKAVDKITTAAMEDAEKNPDGTINRASFERLMEDYTQKTIDANKKQ